MKKILNFICHFLHLKALLSALFHSKKSAGLATKARSRIKFYLHLLLLQLLSVSTVWMRLTIVGLLILILKNVFKSDCLFTLIVVSRKKTKQNLVRDK